MKLAHQAFFIKTFRIEADNLRYTESSSITSIVGLVWFIAFTILSFEFSYGIFYEWVRPPMHTRDNIQQPTVPIQQPDR